MKQKRLWRDKQIHPQRPSLVHPEQMLITVNVPYAPIPWALGCDPKRLVVFGRLWWWGTAVGHSSRTPPLPLTNHRVPRQLPRYPLKARLPHPERP